MEAQHGIRMRPGMLRSPIFLFESLIRLVASTMKILNALSGQEDLYRRQSFTGVVHAAILRFIDWPAVPSNAIELRNRAANAVLAAGIVPSHSACSERTPFQIEASAAQRWLLMWRRNARGWNLSCLTEMP
jgi:hypothetical protein